MNEEIREMEKQAEEELKVKADRDPEKDIREEEQDIEMDKGRSTKNITVKKAMLAGLLAHKNVNML